MIYLDVFNPKTMQYEPKSTRNRAVATLSQSVELLSTLNVISLGSNRQVIERKTQICCISTGRRWNTSSCNGMYEVEVLFWSKSDKRTSRYSIQVHLPIRWSPQFLLVAIWESVVKAHSITIFQMPNPVDHCSAGTDITTINDISVFFNKNLAVLEFKLAIGLASVASGYC